MSAVVVTAVNKNCMKHVVSWVRRIGFLQELIKVQFLWELKPVIDLDVIVSQRVILEPHQLQMQNGRKREKSDTFLGFLHTHR